jgi:branched-chain amino acid transport system substrate-binding protein
MKPGILSFFLCCFVAVPQLQASDRTGSHSKPALGGTVKIGLLIPDDKSKSARQGAELAVLKANERGGFNGRPFLLVVRSMEGPWGTGSKEAVNMIFDDEVTAIIGSHDGRNAHLVEQVTTKTRIVFLSAWATDPTLSQAFVPWYFSCVANDLQQADLLIRAIYDLKANSRLAVISPDDYDAKLGLESYLKRAKAAGKPDPMQFIYNPDAGNASIVLDQIGKAGINCVLLFGKGSVYAKLLDEIVRRKMNLSLFGSLSFLGDDQTTDGLSQPYAGRVVVPSCNWSSESYKPFAEIYRHKYGSAPDALASYAFDGMNLIIEAIRREGIDRENIRKSLSTLHYQGVTGSIRFDSKGNRVGN